MVENVSVTDTPWSEIGVILEMIAGAPPSRAGLRDAQRLREAAIGDAIASSLGAGFTSTHLGGANEVDCIISRGHLKVSAVEITADVDQELQRDLTFSYDNPDQVIRDLLPGYGEWAIQFEAGTRLDKFASNVVVGLIDDIVRHGRIDFDCHESMARNSIFQRYVNLGVVFAFKMPLSIADRAQLMFGHRPGSVFISSERDLYADYISKFIAQDFILSKIDRLIHRCEDLQAWFALVAGSGSPNSVLMRSRGVSQNPGLPTRRVELPQGLGSVWFVNESLVPQLVVDSTGRCQSIDDFRAGVTSESFASEG